MLHHLLNLTTVDKDNEPPRARTPQPCTVSSPQNTRESQLRPASPRLLAINYFYLAVASALRRVNVSFFQQTCGG